MVPIKLTIRERKMLCDVLSDGKAGYQKTVRARVLLLADGSAQGPAQRDRQISEDLGVSMSMVWSIRQRFAKGRLSDALERRRLRGSRMPIKLTAKERRTLCDLVSDGKVEHQKIVRARVLLLADASRQGPAQRDRQISECLGVDVTTIWNIRQRFAKGGLHGALERRKWCRSSARRALTDVLRPHVIALCRSDPPEGAKCWTLRLLAEKLVELKIVPRISHESVRIALKGQKESTTDRLFRHVGDVIRPHVLTLCRSDPPEGAKCWTTRLLAEKLVELKIVSRVSPESVRIVLKGRKKSTTDRLFRHVADVIRPHVLALCRSDPPEGAKRWTLRLLARKLAELKNVPRASHESVRIALKGRKKSTTDRKKKSR